MTRSQNGALLLSCAALSSATPCRFIPALSLITLSARTSTICDHLLRLPELGWAGIIRFMALQKKIHPVEETVRAVYEKGVLKPLRPLRLKEQSRVLITLYPERRWRDEFERVLGRMKARTKATPQNVIEAEVTRARAEVKAKRRAARRSA
jgi:predicted DNA-binding antitoxin AbrB/MazE fold protein